MSRRRGKQTVPLSSPKKPDEPNFSTREKRERICEQMSISMDELEEMRRTTRAEALKRIRHNESAAVAADERGYPGKERG